jgi:hypothetical protein
MRGEDGRKKLSRKQRREGEGKEDERGQWKPRNTDNKYH